MDDYTFISYTHEDTRFALKLARHLKKGDMPIRIDQGDVEPDEEWDSAIEHLVRRCHYFLVILSPASVNSWVVQAQISQAIELGKPIIVVLYQPCERPPLLQDVPCFDFTGRNFRSAFYDLLTYYFPDQEFTPKSMVWLQKAWGNTTRFWYNTLLPLFWPGWLGPVLLILLLLSGIMVLWQSEVTGVTIAEPRYDGLALVRPTPTPAPLPIQTQTRLQDNQLMVQVPAGEFLLGSIGSDPDASVDEKPQRIIHIDTFWIDQTEITYIQYQACVEAGVCASAHPVRSSFHQGNLPIVGVDWEQSSSYCHWVGGHLPTEAEWEKAARGIDARRYPWGNEFDGTLLNYCDANCVEDGRDQSTDDGYGYLAPVGSYPAGSSPYGALDMSGNVWEWTADWYASDSYRTLLAKNPSGPESGVQRVIRGGSWFYNGRNLRVAKRHRDVPSSNHDNIGFRCALPAAEMGDDQASQ